MKDLNYLELGAGLLFGAGLGAGIMYLFDPDRGRARRAKLEDKSLSLCHTAEKKAEDVFHHITKRVAERA